MTDAREAAPAEILTFWRDAGRERWYRRDDAFDAEVRRRYLALWRKAAAGETPSRMSVMEQAFAARAVQAAAFFSSRNSRRRIFPTLVFGRSVRNSICFGTL